MVNSRATQKSTRNSKKVSFAKGLGETKNSSKKVIVTKKAQMIKKIAKKNGNESIDAESFLKNLMSKKTVLNNRNMTTNTIMSFTGNTKKYDKEKDKNVILFWWTMMHNKEIKNLCEVGTSGIACFLKLL